MPNAVIIDDEADARSSLRQLLTRYCPRVEVVGMAAGVADGEIVIRQQTPELVFLDIKMEDGTGFDLLARFVNPDFGVIFTTAFDHFALKAFQYHTIDYLVKPIAPEDLCRAVAKARRNRSGPRYTEQLTELIRSVEQRSFEKIALSTSEGLTLVRLRELIRLEASSSYTTFFVRGGEKIMVARSLREFDDLLPDTAFFRVHQSHLINLHFVNRVCREDGGYILMEDGAQVSISRRRKEAFLRKLRDLSIH